VSTALDNAVWHALSTCHAPIAEVVGAARRYPPDVSVFGAIDGFNTDSWASLRQLVEPGGSTVLFRREIGEVPPGWRVLLEGTGNQFVAPALAPVEGSDPPPIVALGPEHAEQMVALAALTRPGPFGARTYELGQFAGVIEDGRLIAMAGERFHLAGYTEISAVCTDPDARGRRLAAHLTHHVAARIQERGETPFLHVAEGNDGARRVYERLGFTLRTAVRFAAIAPMDEA
jgi:ribosomal protein S18 acetylase RimI-like enzyme